MSRRVEPGQADPCTDAIWGARTLTLELDALDRTIFDTELHLLALRERRASIADKLRARDGLDEAKRKP